MTNADSITQNPLSEFRNPWGSCQYKQWMIDNCGDFFLHPSEIIRRSLTLAEFRHTGTPSDLWPVSAIYFLIVDRQIVYVGITSNLFTRIETHTKTKPFDAITVIPLSWENLFLEIVEAEYIGWLSPWFNVKTPKSHGIFDSAKSKLLAEQGPIDPFMYGGTHSMDVVRLANGAKKNMMYPLHLAARKPVWSDEIKRLDADFRIAVYS